MHARAPGPTLSRLLLGVVALIGFGGSTRAEPAAGWAGDVERGAGPQLIDWVEADLARVVAAKPEQRAAAVDAFVRDSFEGTVEAVKRFRNPELLSLFHAMLRHPDWRVVHRALLALERCEDGTAWSRAWALLEHPEPRLREKAAVTCLRLWEAGGNDVPRVAAMRVAALRARETDPALRACLDALAARAAGTLVVDRVSTEARVTDARGLVLTPFLRKMSTAREVAPGWRPRFEAREGKGSAAALPVAERWSSPLLGYGSEEVPTGFRLQPFGFERAHGRVHTGIDVGAFLDGAGLYAVAGGVVTLVHTGSDMGTEIVLEHRVPADVSPDGLACSVYMHAADVVFVRADDLVRSGQLLGSIGLGYSTENGGHFAHLHLGLYPGPFRPGHNYGYKLAAEGLEDWLDPEEVLARRVPGFVRHPRLARTVPSAR